MTGREQLEQAIAALEAQRSALGDAVVGPAIAALREKLAALKVLSAALEQRKQITVLFADVSGFTAMSEAMDAEEVRDTMNALWARIDEAITAQGGAIDKHIGDAVMALFGTPTAREDDPERAIRAALAMQAELAAFREARPAELAMRIGINTGPVLLGEVGTTAEYTAMGDTVNLASRLEHAAPVGGILISHDTYRHVRGLFDVQALEPISVKGKTERIQVYVVQGARQRPFRATTRGMEGIETPMIGREIELRHLQEALHNVMREREAQIITVVGEAGVGKSRLLHEFNNCLKLPPETLVYFKGRASQQTRDLPYALLHDLLARRFEIQDSDPAAVAREKLERGIVAFLSADGAEKAHFIGRLIGFDFSPSPYLRGAINDAQQIHDRAFHYIAQLFTAVTSPPPTAATASLSRAGKTAVIFLEDIHWSDDGSLDLVNHLARECRQTPLLIIALARPELFERRPSWSKEQEFHTSLELRPLSKRYSRRLVGEILRKTDEVPPDLCEIIVRSAEGNPFYVEELIKMLIGDGVIVKGVERWRVEMERLTEMRVPPTLTGVLQARLDRLPPREREILQQASVVGRVFWGGAVERIHAHANRESAGVRADREAVAKEVLEQRQLARLRQMLVTRFDTGEIKTLCFDLGVDYDGLPGEGKANKARELVAYLERHKRLSELVGMGKRLRPDVPWDDALKVMSDTSQGSPFEQRWDGSETQAVLQALREEELIFKWEVSAFAGMREYIFKHAMLRDVTYESVLKRLRRVYHAQVAAWLIEQSGERVREYAGLIGEHYERAREGTQAAEWYGQAAKQAQDTYALETAADYYKKALALEERWKWRQGQVEVLHVLGRRDDEQVALRTLEAAPGAPAFQVAYLWGQYYEAVGEYSQAQAAVERALATCQERGDVVGQARCLVRLGNVFHRQGDHEDAKAWYSQALGLFQDQDSYPDDEAQALAQALNGLGTVQRQQGQFEQAQASYGRALALSQTMGDRMNEARALSNLGAIAFYRRHFAEALTHHRQALEIRRTIGDRAGEGTSLHNLAMTASEAGDYGQAKEHLSAALTIYQATGDRWNESIAWNSVGILDMNLGDFSSAKTCLERGLALAEEIGDEAGRAYLLANLGLAVGDQGDWGTAERLLTEGLGLAQTQDDKPLITYFLTYLGIVHLQAGRLDPAEEYAKAALVMQRELDLHSRTTDDLTTLATISLATGDVAQAMEYAQQALAILEECGGEGPEFPQRDYFVCYQVLSAAEQKETARAALQSAHDLIMARADKITDPALRQSFLERVPINREIVQKYENMLRDA